MTNSARHRHNRAAREVAARIIAEQPRFSRFAPFSPESARRLADLNDAIGLVVNWSLCAEKLNACAIQKTTQNLAASWTFEPSYDAAGMTTVARLRMVRS